MLSAAKARELIKAGTPPAATEHVPLVESSGRFLARAVVAQRQLPPWDNSAMDGFAVRVAELPGSLTIAGTIAAGALPNAELPVGKTLKIMTGAPMPDGADAVVMRENVDDQGETAVFKAAVSEGNNVRRAGEDVALGDEVLKPGIELGPGEIGLVAALGQATVEVGRRPRVAILSTGDELVDLGTEIGPGKIVNSNAYALAAQVKEAGGIVVSSEIVADSEESTRDALTRALDADVLISSGGVSVGDFDFVQDGLKEVGVDVRFWKVAVKPGKPLVFGVGPRGQMVFGLPGNPVSSMMVFELFARPALLAMQGAASIERARAEVTLESDYKKKPGRSHYCRATIRRDGQQLFADIGRHQGSGRLRSMVGVDAIVELDSERGDVAAGERASALLLRPL